MREIKSGLDRRREAEERPSRDTVASDMKPLLMLDIDGVISLFGFSLADPPPGRFHSIEGVPHYLSASATRQIARLASSFELVWASGWEERANDHLPHLLGLPGPLPFLTFDRSHDAGASGPGSSMKAHWKLAAVESHAGDRPLAWVDDAFNDACEQWAMDRAAPTLLMKTEPAVGLTSAQVEGLLAFATSGRER